MNSSLRGFTRYPCASVGSLHTPKAHSGWPHRATPPTEFPSMEFPRGHHAQGRTARHSNTIRSSWRGTRDVGPRMRSCMSYEMGTDASKAFGSIHIASAKDRLQYQQIRVIELWDRPAVGLRVRDELRVECHAALLDAVGHARVPKPLPVCQQVQSADRSVAEAENVHARAWPSQPGHRAAGIRPGHERSRTPRPSPQDRSDGPSGPPRSS